MTQLPARFVEDRALRDKARAVLAEDIARLRDNLGEQGIASRVSSGVTSSISSRIRTGARDVLDQAKGAAGDRKGMLAVLIGALLLWFARGPIFEWIEELREGFDEADASQDPEAPAPVAPPQGDPA